MNGIIARIMFELQIFFLLLLLLLFSMRMQYGLLARGEVSVFIRLPRAGYQEYIWDAAAGAIIVQEVKRCTLDIV